MTVYRWTSRDKLIYAAVLLPFLIAVLGALYILGTFSIYLALMAAAIFGLASVFQAGCCRNCPYRGGFCPAAFGIYPANLISRWLVKDREWSFKRCAFWAELLLALDVLFPLYWLWQAGWYYPVAFLLLLGLHTVLFFPLICPKCSYNRTCPGGIITRKLLSR
jgi:hypothetical protein